MSENLSPEQAADLKELSELREFLKRGYEIFSHPIVDIRNKETARAANIWKADIKKYLNIE